MFSSSKFLVAVAVATVVSGQSVLDSLTPSCTAALKGLLVSPDAQCLNTGAFLSISLGSGTVDVPAIATKWLTGLCSSGSCSDASLAAIVSNITAGCTEDAQNLFNVDLTSPNVLSLVEQYYPTVREVACLKDDSANALCVPQTLTNLQNIIGPLGADSLQANNIFGDGNKIAASNYSNLACTSCTKQAYTIVAKVFPEPDILASVNGPITTTCGASFTDGQNVTTVSQTAKAGAFNVNTPNGVATFRPITVAGGMLVAISSAFALFA